MFDEEFRVVRQRRWVDLTPLVDLTYILFIFFIVTTTFAKTGIPVNAPQSKHVESTKLVQLDVYIDKNGSYFYESAPITGPQLHQLIQQKILVHKDTVLVLNPDRDTKTQYLLDVIDISKDAGATNFSIASKKKL
ncbi:MAG: hypothetical protein DKM50_13890 [Candidatus Margulisiibacteriota bacterium]|nr:MAG: hypothetical protein A2X43_09065 [Candidatus Margulisbacteria bacterium GWD2_39_127]OGI03574.1 MAG: hypothetical protein A2X42_00905 [Candidatus Margulisbacteria bacterium GWF2_38_17]OGI11079.1 MAG: hypothetical protein A2X41_02200 [Candidatus Margulisbacteria bacterium GWE2_39_32]PZM77078.1 MAG: hypothetical protein DKM50_13890 [Candidatus Margulisiibacteriota bacterium]HAR62325.1 hypothetical protein [Candidatus Margulisiibacteriota bacterium]